MSEVHSTGCQCVSCYTPSGLDAKIDGRQMMLALVRQQAAVIEDLQAELAAIKAQASDATEYVLAGINRELRSENERLRTALQGLVDAENSITVFESDEAGMSLISMADCNLVDQAVERAEQALPTKDPK